MSFPIQMFRSAVDALQFSGGKVERGGRMQLLFGQSLHFDNTVVEVTDHVSGCGYSNIRSINARVTDYADWIHKITGHRSGHPHRSSHD
jgi:hypothetical protein